MEAARFEVGPSRRIAQQGDFGGKAEVTLNVFFDSSALAKRYIEEKGSDQVQAVLSSASALAVSVICIPEILSALCRRRRERKLSTEAYRDAKASVLSDIDDATVIGITDEVTAQAVALLERFRSVVPMPYMSLAPRSGRQTYSFPPTTVSVQPLERMVSESKR